MLNRVDIATEPLDEYAGVIGADQIDRLRDLAERLRGIRILHVNATPYGGGVSELLRSALALQRGLGLKVDWRVIAGETKFFEVTKRFHNALQGAPYDLPAEDQETYLLQNMFNAHQFGYGYDLVIIHDPQPVPLLAMHGRGNARWVWRCHIDTSAPNEKVLKFLKPYIDAYDALIFTLDKFVPESLRSRRIALIPPGIDPSARRTSISRPSKAGESWPGSASTRPDR